MTLALFANRTSKIDPSFISGLGRQPLLGSNQFRFVSDRFDDFPNCIDNDHIVPGFSESMGAVKQGYMYFG